jgi:hypothetical protein
MASLVLTGDTSGAITVSAPAVAGTNTLTLQAATATSSVNTLGTAVASTSGTSIDFTGLPSWIKRITIIFNEVSGSASSHRLIQLGTGSTSYTTSGYLSTGAVLSATAVNVTNSTAGYIVYQDNPAYVFSGQMVLTNISGNIWICSHVGKIATNSCAWGGGSVTLGAALTAVRITTVNGTDTFDAGSVNILYEG